MAFMRAIPISLKKTTHFMNYFNKNYDNQYNKGYTTNF